MGPSVVVVVGLGEVGKPLLAILSRAYTCVGVDLEPVEVEGNCYVLHICYPFQIPDFVSTTAAYIRKYKPALAIINSTVAPGTTRQIASLSGVPVAYSPVRGKHAKMEEDMLFYKKFVGADDPAVATRALEHFAQAGFKTDRFLNAETGELAKLLETTWLGILVGWAQEVERMGQKYHASYEDLNVFIKEISFLPRDTFPGFIGGHCVMANIAILQTQLQSDFLDAVVKSNRLKERGKAAISGGSSL